jgi:creatinine amidohydrolase
VRRWGEARYPELEGLAGRRTAALLPLGAVEAHGPHLPLATDVVIAEAMARDGARRLALAGVESWILPSLAYAPAPFADGFAGTLSIAPATLAALLEDIAAAAAERGVGALALINVHFDPSQVTTVREAAARIAERGRPRIVFPDLTRRGLAARLTDEFRRGACHAGRFESSILLAERPELVDEAARRALPPREVSLSEAIRGGRTSFEEAGLPAAYCGDPAAATAEEGREIVALLGEILAEAVLAAFAAGVE